jgi:AraC-like DNA-binding protein
MERAAELLLSTDAHQSAIKNIPAAIGYKTLPGFLKAFKRHFNVYPSDYVAGKRKKRRHKND